LPYRCYRFGAGWHGANAGTINSGDAINGTGTDALGRTSVKSVDLGINGNTTETLVLTFSQAVSNPYLFFTYTDAGDSVKFLNPFILIDSNNAQVAGDTVTFVGAGNSQNDGFIVQLLGSYAANTQISFLYNNPNAGVESVAFTAGVDVPAPLPLMGASVAFGFSHRLRRRIRARV